MGQAAYLDTLMSVPSVSADENALCGIDNTSSILKTDPAQVRPILRMKMN
ncbi:MULTISPECIES: hypothetical protein [Prevotellaceae]|nr:MULTISPECIES: hypothetical protein [Prevotellaceae]